jgi:hypothetical protein
MIQVPKNLEARLEAAALEQGVSKERILEDALNIFLRQPVRRNAKGFIIPSFVGAYASGDPTWIDRHEELLWTEE